MPKAGIRKLARGMGFDRYRISNACINGHMSERYAKNGACVQCSREQSKMHHIENREHRLAYNVALRKKRREEDREYRRQYLQDNLDKHRKTQAKHRAMKLQATYGNEELNDLVFGEAYKLSKLREEATGVPHHVDHIVPLLGKTVCGFHSWNNIRVIPASENMSKSNKIVEDLF
jgi:hypothetical protein